jgi:hypothetical protein
MSRITKIFTAITMIAVLAGAIALAAPRALASDGTFNVSVYHNINGKALGLSKALPVQAYIYKDGGLLATVPLEFGDRVTTNLPAGNYTIKVFSEELGAFVPSMQVGPVDLPEGVKVRLQARLGAGGTPDLVARVK